MHEIDTRCSAACGACEREQEERKRNGEPGPPPEIPHDAVSVREPEVRKRRRGDHAHLEPSLLQVLDRVPHEHAGDVARVARIGRCENRPLTCAPPARPKTTGKATASTAKT